MSEVMEKLGINHDQWSRHKDTFESVIWKGDPACTKTEWDDAVKEVENDYKNTQYQRDRLAEYPSIQELVVALYDADDKAEIDKKRAEIKKKYPKPE